MNAAPSGSDGGSRGSTSSQPLGSVREVVGAFSTYNISPDGSGAEGMGEAIGVGFLHGPGLIVEMPTSIDEVNQVIVTITDEDFAWAVLMRLCRQLRWKMVDPESGRSFG